MYVLWTSRLLDIIADPLSVKLLYCIALHWLWFAQYTAVCMSATCHMTYGTWNGMTLLTLSVSLSGVPALRQKYTSARIVGKIQFCLENICKIIHFDPSLCRKVPKNGSKQIRW